MQSSAMLPSSGQARGYRPRLIGRPNLAQPIDVNTLDEMLSAATTPMAMALPVLKVRVRG